MLFLVVLCTATWGQEKKPPAAEPSTGTEKAPAEKKAPAELAEEKDPELLTLDKMELPSTARLLQGPVVDWIVLTSDKVMEVEPVYPRPGTLDELANRIKEHVKQVGPAPTKDEDKAKRLSLNYVQLSLPDGAEREFKLHRQYIKEIIYWEDLMLRRIDRLLDERSVREVFQLLVALDLRRANWPGAVARQERLLFTDALLKLGEKLPEAALVLLEELHGRNPAYPGLSAQLGTVADQLMAAAARVDDFRRARYFLQRLKKSEPNHHVATRWTNDLQEQSRQRLAPASAAEQAGQFDKAVDLAEEAARIWPTTPELTVVHRRVSNRFQRLRVGIVELPEATGVRRMSVSGGERQRQLTESRLFQPARVDDKVVRYGTSFFDEWEPTDLGHSILFRLRQHREGFESQTFVTAGGIAAMLAGKIDPHDGRYDERFAGYVDSLAVRSPLELTVHFRQPPLRPEALFALALDPSHGQFAVHSTDAQGTAYRRAIPERDRAGDWHVAEVIETRYDSHEKAIQGLLRGEVSLLPTVPAWHVKSFTARPEFFTQSYALPVTHLLQFNPHSRVATSRTLRRALVYAVNRPQLLEAVFLHEPSGRLGRLTSAPVAVSSYAYNPLVEPHKHDPTLALSLAAAAKKELLGEVPPLTMLCPPNAAMQEASRQIVEQWKRIGLQVTLVVGDTGAGRSPAFAKSRASDAASGADPETVSPPGERATAPAWDIVYRTVSMAEPLVELWPCLTADGATDVASLTHLPAWLRHELLSLDLAGDWPAAEAILRKLHKQLWAEVHLIPLWELNEHLVARKHVRGVPPRPMFTYQGIERWKVDPWFARD